MKSVKLSKALSSGQVLVRTGRNVTGQVCLKFRNPEVVDKFITPYNLKDQSSPESYINLSANYSADQLKNSNLEDLIIQRDLELR